MKKSNVYTCTGDSGKTSLVGGKRVSKTDLRLTAYGSVDELNSFLGTLLAFINNHETDFSEDKDLILYIQNKLFTVGSYLATDPEFTEFREASKMNDEAINKIENRIDSIDSELPRLNNFVIPGGSILSGQANICRSVCRRAEREILKIHENSELDNNILRFMNRLSDYLFVFSRLCNIRTGTNEVLWDKSCK